MCALSSMVPRVKKLLLINPRAPESFWSFRWALETVLPDKRAVNPPLGLATVAALTPADWEVSIIDENIEPIPLSPDADVIGVCGMGAQFVRQKELLTLYRSRGYFVAAGGSYASLCPEKYADLADVVIAGEAESIWPRFCADFEEGNSRTLYRETAVVSLLDSPTPRFELLKLDRYAMVSLQFSRGCPFVCDFCDIIVMFGRKPRTKSIEQIERELDLLRRLGAYNLFFVDDNFIGNKPAAKQLLRFLRDYQDRFDRPFRFGTEASMNLAQDPELLRLFREANFQWVFVGIESPDEESLREAGKLQNTREDMLVSVRTLYANGIDVFAGFIVGFDHDTIETFDRQYDFIMKSGIQVAMVGLLTALPRTPLYERLASEGRLLPIAQSSDNTSLGINFVPKRMSAESMIAGYKALYQRLCADRSIAARIRMKMRYLAPSTQTSGYALREMLVIGRRLMRSMLRDGGLSRLFHFFRTAIPQPGLFPSVVSDWVTGLSMRSFATRHLTGVREPESSVARGYQSLVKRLRKYVHAGSVEISRDPVVSLTLSGYVDRRFFANAARSLDRLLRKGRSPVSLVINQIDPGQVPRLERMLRRLARHADRISLSVARAVMDMEIDWSRFEVALHPQIGQWNASGG
jgi:radical SAM superfamily enzyme YgiQ (UPF0313 family)